MMKKSVALIYIESQTILDFLQKHPIDWAGKDLAALHGVGDSAGMPPTTMAEEFLCLLRDTQALFTQQDFASHCLTLWESWLRTKTPQQRAGVKAKLCRNFYPAMIDQLHVWSMLAKAGWFDRCILDACDDATTDTDLTLCRGALTHHIALLGPPTQEVALARTHKTDFRNRGHHKDVQTFQLSWDRPRNPGNKLWWRC